MPTRDLLPCPFCGNALYIKKGKFNPAAYCKTESCYGAKMPVVNLDVGDDVAAWNRRASSEAPSGAEPVVKRLEWEEPSSRNNQCWTAESPLGTYSVVNEDGWYAVRDDVPRDFWFEWTWRDMSRDNLLTAQAACQADFEARIRSALRTPAKAVAPTEGIGELNILTPMELEQLRSALAPGDADKGEGQPCEDCGRPSLVWFAPNKLWNLVKGGPGATDDPGGHLCPYCFIIRAERSGVRPTAWVVSEEAIGQANAARQTAWLIQRHDQGEFAKPHWYAETESGWHWWTKNPAAAKQFASQAEADESPAYRMIAADPSISVKEHIVVIKDGAAAYQTENAKRGWTGRIFEMDGASVHLDEVGDAVIAFKEADLQHDGDGPHIKLAASEVIELGKYLSKTFALSGASVDSDLPEGTPVSDLVEALNKAGDPLHRRAAETISHIRRIAVDRFYMMQAYRSMLGEKGLDVARSWDEKNVQRVHYEWSGAAAQLSGEERAAEILRWESVPGREATGIDADLPERIDWGMAIRKGEDQ